jgi:hypothetical protein
LAKALRKASQFRIFQKCSFGFNRLTVHFTRLEIDPFQFWPLLGELPFKIVDLFVELTEIEAKRLVVGRHLVKVMRVTLSCWSRASYRARESK